MKNHSLWHLVKSDLQRYTHTFRLRGQPYNAFRVIFESFLFKPGFQAVFLYRVSHSLHRMGLNYFAWATARYNQFLTGAEIEFNAVIGPGFLIAHPSGIIVGRGSRIGSNCTLFQGVSFGVKDWAPENIRSFPSVGDSCMFFAGAGAFGGITLGSQCIIGAHAVVITDVADGCVVVGNPARVIPNKGAENLRRWGLCAE